MADIDPLRLGYATAIILGVILAALALLCKGAKHTEQKLNPKAFGFASSIVSGGAMLAIGLLGALGLYEGGTRMMEQWHVFFSTSALGIIAGAIETAVVFFLLGYAFAAAYNKFA